MEVHSLEGHRIQQLVVPIHPGAIRNHLEEVLHSLDNHQLAVVLHILDLTQVTNDIQKEPDMQVEVTNNKEVKLAMDYIHSDVWAEVPLDLTEVMVYLLVTTQ